MDFRQSTSEYEEWLATQLTIVPEDIELKHKLMREKVFSFFRATFYRFAQLWPELCPESADAPRILAVGDLHLENFGTWRDVEGRLVWGINDFDEVTRMPYTIDLVRLAVSAHLAIGARELQIPREHACLELLKGYQAGLKAGGLPWVMGAQHVWLHEMVNPSLRDPVGFWQKLEALPPLKTGLPGSARRALGQLMPPGGDTEKKTSKQALKWKISHRVAGLGSLGRQRFVAVADYKGAPLCREAKELATSAWDWARGVSKGRIRYQQALDTAVRAIDPFVRLEGRWIVRRLAPDCSKINISAFPRRKDESRLLQAMGWETANLHLGSGRREELLKDLARRKAGWLHTEAMAMVKATTADWNEWRSPETTKKKAPTR